MEEINEKLAKIAKNMNSFNDYIEGSATNSYIRQCNEIKCIAEERKKKIPKEHWVELDKLVSIYCAKLARWLNKENANRASCPSIMISGSCNVNKKEKQIARENNLIREYENEIETLKTKIEYFGFFGFPIKSGDSDAILKLEEKLAKAEENQRIMKLRNAYFRKHNTLKGCEGVSDELAAQIEKQIENDRTLNKIPYPSYKLTNNNANINRIRQRIKYLQKEKTTEGQKYDSTELNLKVVENKDIMRLQLIFNDKPSEEIREMLKNYSFKWSPKHNAWQRQLTDNARHSLKQILSKLKELKTNEKKEVQ